MPEAEKDPERQKRGHLKLLKMGKPSAAKRERPGDWSVQNGELWRHEFPKWRDLETGVSKMERPGDTSGQNGETWRLECPKWGDLETRVAKMERPGDWSVQNGET